MCPMQFIGNGAILHEVGLENGPSRSHQFLLGMGIKGIGLSASENGTGRVGRSEGACCRKINWRVTFIRYGVVAVGEPVPPRFWIQKGKLKEHCAVQFHSTGTVP
jgi:hypothetical protein